MPRAAVHLLCLLGLAALAAGCTGTDGVDLSGGMATASAPPPAEAPVVDPAPPAPIQGISVEDGKIYAEGSLSDPCWQVVPPVVEREGNRISAVIGMRRSAEKPDPCPVRLPVGFGWPLEVPGGLTPGDYTVTVNGVTAEVRIP